MHGVLCKCYKKTDRVQRWGIKMTNAIVDVQVIPQVPDDSHLYDYVDEAISVIEAEGVQYTVNPLGTTMEGDMALLVGVVKKINEKLVQIGAHNVITQMKMVYDPAGIQSETLVKKYR